jgi:hypothetical protein
MLILAQEPILDELVLAICETLQRIALVSTKSMVDSIPLM